MRRASTLVVAVALAVAHSACAETIVEVDDAVAPADSSEETAPTTTLPTAGSAAELLPELAT